MFTSIFTAISSFEMIGLGKDHQSLFIEVVIGRIVWFGLAHYGLIF